MTDSTALQPVEAGLPLTAIQLKARLAVIQSVMRDVMQGELLLAIKALRKEADSTFDPIIADAHRAHRTACDQKRKVEEPLTTAERLIKNALVAYDTEQERIRREEQRRREEEAKRQAEAEALDRAAALEAEGTGWGDAGLIHEAHQIVEEAIHAPAPPVAVVKKETPNVQGISFRTTWSGQLLDLKALIAHCATHPEHAHLLQVNQTALNNMARAMQAGLNKIPGVRAVSTRDVAAGR